MLKKRSRDAQSDTNECCRFSFVFFVRIVLDLFLNVCRFRYYPFKSDQCIISCKVGKLHQTRMGPKKGQFTSK